MRGYLTNNAFSKLLLLIGTAFPGFTKLVAIIWIEKTSGSVALGLLLSDVNITTMFTYFTAIGWSAVLITRVAKENDRAKQLNFLWSVHFQAIPSMIIAMIAVVTLYFLGVIVDAPAMLAFLMAYSSYQMLRHYYFGLKSPVSVFSLELLIFVSLVLYISLNFYSVIGSGWIFVTPILLSVFVVVLMLVQGSILNITANVKLQRDVTEKALMFGFSNLTSGGILMALVPIVNYYATPNYAAVVGILVTMIGFILIFSRTITNYYLPLMAVSVGKSDVKKLRRSIRVCRLISTATIFFLSVILMVSTALIAPYYFENLYNLNGFWAIFSLLLTYVFLGQIFLADAALIVVQEKGYFSAILNASAFGVGAILAVVSYFMLTEGSDRIVMLLTGLNILQLLKGIAMIENTRSELRTLRSRDTQSNLSL